MEGEVAAPPLSFGIVGAKPNPFNPSTEITYSIPAGPPSRVRLDVYDVCGRHVRALVDRDQSAGLFAVPWDGRDENAARVSSGIYFCRLRAGGREQTSKIVMVE